jgi:hypothetical protein
MVTAQCRADGPPPSVMVDRTGPFPEFLASELPTLRT